jgi:hypothetical protein
MSSGQFMRLRPDSDLLGVHWKIAWKTIRSKKFQPVRWFFSRVQIQSIRNGTRFIALPFIKLKSNVSGERKSRWKIATFDVIFYQKTL